MFVLNLHVFKLKIMRYLLTSLTVIMLAGLSSCTRDDRYYPQPDYPQSYTFVDEFTDNRNQWNFTDNAYLAYGYISNGTYKIDYENNVSPAYYVSKNIHFNRYDDFTIYTRIGSDNNMGLLFGYDSRNGSYGYSFTVSYDGYYALYDEGGNGYGDDVQAIVPLQTAGFVAGRGDWNELRLEQRGSRWIGYINNQQVFNIEAQPLYGTNVGFILMSDTHGEADYIETDWYE